MKQLGSIVFFLVLGSLLLAILGGIIDIAQTAALTKEHLWHDSQLLMLLAILLALVGL
jgi:hypothetical protein